MEEAARGRPGCSPFGDLDHLADGPLRPQSGFGQAAIQPRRLRNGIRGEYQAVNGPDIVVRELPRGVKHVEFVGDAGPAAGWLVWFFGQLSSIRGGRSVAQLLP